MDEDQIRVDRGELAAGLRTANHEYQGPYQVHTRPESGPAQGGLEDPNHPHSGRNQGPEPEGRGNRYPIDNAREGCGNGQGIGQKSDNQQGHEHGQGIGPPATEPDEKGPQAEQVNQAVGPPDNQIPGKGLRANRPGEACADRRDPEATGGGSEPGQGGAEGRQGQKHPAPDTRAGRPQG